jgi:hypothetical protein
MVCVIHDGTSQGTVTCTINVLVRPQTTAKKI